MHYSPIKTFRLRNFMGIEDLTVNFDGSSRMVLEGYNSSGKSSIGMGLDVLATNSFSKEQKNFIKDTPYQAEEFILDCVLQSGHTITYVKGKKTYYYVVELDGETLLDTRLSDGTHSVVEENKVPLLVHQLLGFLKEPTTGQKLNLRRSRDGMLFVGVPGSTNFKVVYRQLDLPEVVDSIKDLNNDKVAMDRTITKHQNHKAFLQESYSEIVVHDQEMLESIQSDVHSIVNNISTMQQIKNSHDVQIELESKLKPYMNSVCVAQYSSLSKLFSSVQTMETLEKKVRDSVILTGVESEKIRSTERLSTMANAIDTLNETIKRGVGVSTADTAKLKLLVSLGASASNIDKANKSMENLAEVPFNSGDLTILLNKQRKLSSINTVYNQYSSIIKQGEHLENESKDLRTQLATLRNEIKSSGMTVCPRCSNVFEVADEEVLV